jgi:hypothetical protein
MAFRCGADPWWWALQEGGGAHDTDWLECLISLLGITF